VSFINSTFFLFFIIVFILYWIARNKVLQNIILLLASYVFYGWFNPFYCILLFFTTLTDYLLALGMDRSPSRKKTFFMMSIGLNVGVLAFFKYVNFFIPSIVAFLTRSGIAADATLIQILLPAGLSFYTLKKISYMVDVYRKTAKPIYSFIDFALYVSFFPQLISGPIDRSQSLVPQIEQPRTWKGEHVYRAWPLIVMGLFKKIVIADTVKIVVDKIFMLALPSKALLLVGTLGFMLEILADFSAYTDLSRGLAFLLGFETPENFRSPYLATSPTDFWNRWHITLSTWLRDYIFFPIRRALLRKRTQLAENLAGIVPPLITMLVSGIWHGVGWTYLAWGLFHGMLLVIYQLPIMRKAQNRDKKTKNFFAWLVMFCLIAFSWLIFRAPSMAWLGSALLNSSWLGSFSQGAVTLAYGSIVIFFGVLLVVKVLVDRLARHWSIAETVFLVIATALVIVFTQPATSDFLYVQF
jgi:alginate O-acetyltransferase complex protein AlgI